MQWTNAINYRYQRLLKEIEYNSKDETYKENNYYLIAGNAKQTTHLKVTKSGGEITLKRVKFNSIKYLGANVKYVKIFKCIEGILTDVSVGILNSNWKVEWRDMPPARSIG